MLGKFSKILLVCLALAPSGAFAAPDGVIRQSDAICDPNAPTHCLAPTTGGGLPNSAKLSTLTSGTIAVTNTYQSVTPLNLSRSGCTFYNNGTNTMYIYLDFTGGSTPPVGNTKSVSLNGGSNFSCTVAGNTVLGDKIWVTGTANDTFLLVSY